MQRRLQQFHGETVFIFILTLQDALLVAQFLYNRQHERQVGERYLSLFKILSFVSFAHYLVIC